MANCDFDNDAMTCPQCGFVAGGKDWKRNCTDHVRARQRPDTCSHRGAEIRQQECETCSGHQRIKVFACPLRGECTIGKKLPVIVCCAVIADCGDFSPTAD